MSKVNHSRTLISNCKWVIECTNKSLKVSFQFVDSFVVYLFLKKSFETFRLYVQTAGKSKFVSQTRSLRQTVHTVICMWSNRICVCIHHWPICMVCCGNDVCVCVAKLQTRLCNAEAQEMETHHFGQHLRFFGFQREIIVVCCGAGKPFCRVASL